MVSRKAESKRDPAVLAAAEAQVRRHIADNQEVAGRAQLASLHLVSSAFHVAPEYYATLGASELPIYDFAVRFGGGSLQNGTASGMFTWAVMAKVQERETLRAECTYVIAYANLDALAEDACMRFVRDVGEFATYPYFRALVSHLSWASEAQLPMLPVISNQSRPPRLPAEGSSFTASTQPRTKAQHAKGRRRER